MSRNIQRGKGRKPIVTQGKRSPYGVVYMISATRYSLDGSVGTNDTVQKGRKFALDTGAGYQIIRRYALQFGWKEFVYTKGNVTWLNDANRQPLYLTQIVLLPVRFGNMHYVCGNGFGSQKHRNRRDNWNRVTERTLDWYMAPRTTL